MSFPLCNPGVVPKLRKHLLRGWDGTGGGASLDTGVDTTSNPDKEVGIRALDCNACTCIGLSNSVLQCKLSSATLQ